MSIAGDNISEEGVYHVEESKEIFYAIASPSAEKVQKSYPKKTITVQDFLEFTRRVTGVGNIQKSDISHIYNLLCYPGRNEVDFRSVQLSLRDEFEKNFFYENFDFFYSGRMIDNVDELVFLCFVNVIFKDYQGDLKQVDGLKLFTKKYEENRLKIDIDIIQHCFPSQFYVIFEAKYKDKVENEAHQISKNFEFVVSALNCLDNCDGLKEVVSLLSLINFSNDCRKIEKISKFLKEFFEAYLSHHLFPQTVNLLRTTKDEQTAEELSKIFYLMFKCLKLKNKNFNFQKFIEENNLEVILFGDKTFENLFNFLLKSENDQIFNFTLLALSNTIIYGKRINPELYSLQFLEYLFNTLLNEEFINRFDSIAYYLYTLARKMIITSKEKKDSYINFFGKTGLRLMKMNDEMLFRYGLRLVAMVVETQKPDSEFEKLYSSLKNLLFKDTLIIKSEILTFMNFCSKSKEFSSMFIKDQEMVNFLVEGAVGDQGLISKLSFDVLNAIFSFDNLNSFIDQKIHKKMQKCSELSYSTRLAYVNILSSVISKNKTSIQTLAESKIILSLLKSISFSSKRDSHKQLNFKNPIIKFELFSKSTQVLGKIIESGFLDEANDLNLFKSFVDFEHIKHLDSIVSRLKEIKPQLVEFVNNGEGSVSKGIVSFVELLSLFKRIFMGKKDKITAKQVYLLQEELVKVYSDTVVGSDRLRRKIFGEKIIDLQDVEMIIRTSLIPGESNLDDNREMHSKGEIFFNNFVQVLEQKYTYAKPFFIQVKDKDGFYITIDSDIPFKTYLEENFDKEKMTIFAKFYIKPKNPDFWKNKGMFNNFGNQGIFGPSNNNGLFDQGGDLFGQSPSNFNKQREEKCFYCNRVFIVIKSYDDSTPLVCQNCDQRLSNKPTKPSFFQ